MIILFDTKLLLRDESEENELLFSYLMPPQKKNEIDRFPVFKPRIKMVFEHFN